MKMVLIDLDSNLRKRSWTKCKLTTLTIDRDDSQDEPGGPLWQVFDEYQGHESADHDEVGLLQSQWALPMYADHSYHPKVPDDHCQCEVVHGHVVCFEHLAETLQYVTIDQHINLIGRVL